MQSSLLPSKTQGQAAPATAGTPQPYTIDAQALALTPKTGRELRALRARREELSDQITSATNRRDRIAKQLLDADPSARAGLQERLKVLDNRIVQLEREIDVTGTAIRNAPIDLVASTQGPLPADVFNRVSGDIVPVVAIVSIFVLGPFTLALSRFVWRRASAPPKQAGLDAGTQQRLDQLQQSVDTIAIEVERISEGQRFLSKTLKDSARALPSSVDT